MEQILSELRHLRDDHKEMSKSVAEINTDLKHFNQKFDEHTHKFEPVYQNFMFKQERNRRRSESLKRWSWRLGILAAIISVASIVLTWRLK